MAARDVVLTAPWTALLSATALGAVLGAARSAPTAGLSVIPWHKTCILASRRVMVGPARKKTDEMWLLGENRHDCQLWMWRRPKVLIGILPLTASAFLVLSARLARLQRLHATAGRVKAAVAH